MPATFLFFLFVSCTREPPALVVGEYKISKNDISLRQQVAKVFYPAAPETDLGYQQLLEAYTYAAILKNNGQPITDEILKAESERMDRDSKAPEMLAQVKLVFAGDMEAYKRVFVLPTYAERIIYYGFFLNSPEIQARPIGIVNKLFQLGNGKPGALAAYAKAEKLKKINLIYNEARGLEDEDRPRPGHNMPLAGAPESVQKMMDAQRKSQNSAFQTFLDKHSAWGLKSGQFIPEPLDMETVWLALQVKTLDKKKRTLRFTAFSVPREDFQTWLVHERARIKIEKNAL